MQEVFSQSLADSFVTEFAKHSKLLKLGKFTKTKIASRVFGEKDPKRRYVESFRSSKTSRPLDAAVLQMALDACRSELRSQLEAIGDPVPHQTAADFEKGVCHKYKFKGRQATLDDFRLDRRTAAALSAADFGMPNIIDWQDDQLSFGEDLESLQARSVQAMREVVDQIARESDEHRRLRLLHVALSIAYLNHPGTPWHKTVFNLAHTAASQSELSRLVSGYGISDELQQSATYLDFHLIASRFIPTLDSPTNYLRYALQDARLPYDTWRDLQGSVDEAILAARRYATMCPKDEFAIQLRSGAISLKARFLAVTGCADNLRDADQLQKQSLRDLDRISVPYGYAYPLLKSIVQSKFKNAIGLCEQAVETFMRAGVKTSAAAFGALQFQLTDKYSRGATSDTEIRRLAADALASNAVRYKCSHIFDAASVQVLLAEAIDAPAQTVDRPEKRLKRRPR